MSNYSINDKKSKANLLISEIAKNSNINGMQISENDEFLSLMIDETQKGKNIQSDHHFFFQQLVEDEDLRERYIEALTILYPNSQNVQRMIALIKDESHANQNKSIFSYDSLTSKILLPIEQLQSILFPPQAVFRSINGDENPSFLLVNQKIEHDSINYSLLVDAILSGEKTETLSLSAFLALTKNDLSGFPAFPVVLKINWGDFSQSLKLTTEGQHHLADVPFSAFLNEKLDIVTRPLEVLLSRPQ